MGIAGGSFKSKIFKNDGTDEISVCMRNLSLADHAEKCIEHFNSLSDEVIDEICHRLIESYNLSDKYFELPELQNIREILDYCCFFELIVDIPENNGISYFVEGTINWNEMIGIVIKNGSLIYVGVDYEEYL